MSDYTTVVAAGLSGCIRGQVVAYVGDKFVPAAAGWYQEADGSLRPALSSYVYGVLISSVDSSGYGTILTSGIITDTGIISAMCGSAAPAVGPYYLGTDGRVTFGVPEGLLPVFCGYYSGSGFNFRPAAPEYDGHRHTNYPLSAGLFNSAGAYAGTSDAIYTQITAALPPESVVVLHSGAILTSGSDYTFSNGQLTIPAAGSMSTGYTICGINPLMGTNPEVRAIAPAVGNNVISATKVYGTVYLDTSYPETRVSSGGVCVAGISREGITTAPVVNDIKYTGAMTVVSSGGIYTISTDAPEGSYLDFQTINANNVLVGATTSDTLLTFPEGIAASVLGIVRLPMRNAGSWTFKVFTWPSTGLATSITVINPPTSFGGALTSITSSGTANTTDFVGVGGALVRATLIGSGAQIQAAGVYLVPTNS